MTDSFSQLWRAIELEDEKQIRKLSPKCSPKILDTPEEVTLPETSVDLFEKELVFLQKATDLPFLEFLLALARKFYENEQCVPIFKENGGLEALLKILLLPQTKLSLFKRVIGFLSQILDNEQTVKSFVQIGGISAIVSTIATMPQFVKSDTDVQTEQPIIQLTLLTMLEQLTNTYDSVGRALAQDREIETLSTIVKETVLNTEDSPFIFDPLDNQPETDAEKPEKSEEEIRKEKQIEDQKQQERDRLRRRREKNEAKRKAEAEARGEVYVPQEDDDAKGTDGAKKDGKGPNTKPEFVEYAWLQEDVQSSIIEDVSDGKNEEEKQTSEEKAENDPTVNSTKNTIDYEEEIVSSALRIQLARPQFLNLLSPTQFDPLPTDLIIQDTSVASPSPTTSHDVPLQSVTPNPTPATSPFPTSESTPAPGEQQNIPQLPQIQFLSTPSTSPLVTHLPFSSLLIEAALSLASSTATHSALSQENVLKYITEVLEESVLKQDRIKRRDQERTRRKEVYTRRNFRKKKLGMPLGDELLSSKGLDRVEAEEAAKEKKQSDQAIEASKLQSDRCIMLLVCLVEEEATQTILIRQTDVPFVLSQHIHSSLTPRPPSALHTSPSPHAYTLPFTLLSRLSVTSEGRKAVAKRKGRTACAELILAWNDEQIRLQDAKKKSKTKKKKKDEAKEDTEEPPKLPALIPTNDDLSKAVVLLSLLSIDAELCPGIATSGCVDCLASLLTSDRFVVSDEQRATVDFTVGLCLFNLSLTPSSLVSLSAETIQILFEYSVAVHDTPTNDLSLPVTVQPEKNSSGFKQTSALFYTSQALMNFVTFKNLEERKRKERLRKMKEEEMEEGEEQTEKAKEEEEPAEFGFGLNVEKMVEGLTHVLGVKLSELADEMIQSDEQEEDAQEEGQDDTPSPKATEEAKKEEKHEQKQSLTLPAIFNLLHLLADSPDFAITILQSDIILLSLSILSTLCSSEQSADLDVLLLIESICGFVESILLQPDSVTFLAESNSPLIQSSDESTTTFFIALFKPLSLSTTVLLETQPSPEETKQHFAILNRVLSCFSLLTVQAPSASSEQTKIPASIVEGMKGELSDQLLLVLSLFSKELEFQNDQKDEYENGKTRRKDEKEKKKRDREERKADRARRRAEKEEKRRKKEEEAEKEEEEPKQDEEEQKVENEDEHKTENDEQNKEDDQTTEETTKPDEAAKSDETSKPDDHSKQEETKDEAPTDSESSSEISSTSDEPSEDEEEEPAPLTISPLFDQSSLFSVLSRTLTILCSITINRTDDVPMFSSTDSFCSMVFSFYSHYRQLYKEPEPENKMGVSQRISAHPSRMGSPVQTGDADSIKSPVSALPTDAQAIFVQLLTFLASMASHKPTLTGLINTSFDNAMYLDAIDLFDRLPSDADEEDGSLPVLFHLMLSECVWHEDDQRLKWIESGNEDEDEDELEEKVEEVRNNNLVLLQVLLTAVNAIVANGNLGLLFLSPNFTPTIPTLLNIHLLHAKGIQPLLTLLLTTFIASASASPSAPLLFSPFVHILIEDSDATISAFEPGIVHSLHTVLADLRTSPLIQFRVLSAIRQLSVDKIMNVTINTTPIPTVIVDQLEKLSKSKEQSDYDLMHSFILTFLVLTLPLSALSTHSSFKHAQPTQQTDTDPEADKDAFLDTQNSFVKVITIPSVADCEKEKVRVFEKGISKLLNKIIRLVFKRKREVGVIICSIFANICAYEDQQARFVKEGILQALALLLKSIAEDKQATSNTPAPSPSPSLYSNPIHDDFAPMMNNAMLLRIIAALLTLSQNSAFHDQFEKNSVTASLVSHLQKFTASDPNCETNWRSAFCLGEGEEQWLHSDAQPSVPIRPKFWFMQNATVEIESKPGDEALVLVNVIQVLINVSQSQTVGPQLLNTHKVDTLAKDLCENIPRFCPPLVRHLSQLLTNCTASNRKLLVPQIVKSGIVDAVTNCIPSLLPADPPVPNDYPDTPFVLDRFTVFRVAVLLLYITLTPNGKKAIYDSGCIRCCLDILEVFARDEELVSRMIAVLSNIGMDEDVNKRLLTETGRNGKTTIQVLMRLFTIWANNVEVCERILSAFSTYASNQENCTMLKDANAVDAIMRYISQHKDQDSIVKKGALALNNLTTAEDCCERIVQCHGVELLQWLLTSIGMSDMKSLMRVIGAITNLAQHTEINTQISSTQITAILAQILDKMTSKTETEYQNTARTIGQKSNPPQTTPQQIQSIIQKMKLADGDLVDRLLAAYVNLSRNRDNSRKMLSQHVTDFAVSVMRRYLQSGVVFESEREEKMKAEKADDDDDETDVNEVFEATVKAVMNDLKNKPMPAFTILPRLVNSVCELSGNLVLVPESIDELCNHDLLGTLMVVIVRCMERIRAINEADDIYEDKVEDGKVSKIEQDKRRVRVEEKTFCVTTIKKGCLVFFNQSDDTYLARLVDVGIVGLGKKVLTFLQEQGEIDYDKADLEEKLDDYLQHTPQDYTEQYSRFLLLFKKMVQVESIAPKLKDLNRRNEMDEIIRGGNTFAQLLAQKQPNELDTDSTQSATVARNRLNLVKDTAMFIKKALHQIP
ncbi:hypothetical protein BLNAU_4182 [Blattamonas nauphoetae]|uniref:Uncharacterized protein n=1 Tax=Blattamonas nauphoetae TaxID=2049346 RepID=A0ABQ9YAS2_9EUKA|nr:hypothetical protein BLNAU_4182 [Blattamonas nauphoetae]